MRARVRREYFAGLAVTHSREIALWISVAQILESLLRVEDPQTLVAGLVATHGNQLRRFLLARVRNVDDVPDIVQEVYLRMLRIPNIESIRSPEAYLFTVAQHVVYQHTLSQAATPPSVELTQILNPPAPPDGDPALEADALQCLEQLQAALEELAPKIRATFLLHRRDGLSLDEIGTRLGISRGMVKKYLMKALMHFRQRLERAQ
jgi:RNA polymerase sigma factor (sigma-70 family)